MKRKRALILTTVSGFLPKFELQNVKLLQELGYEVHYASNPAVPIYRNSCDYNALGIRRHRLSIQKSPLAVWANARALWELRRLQKQYQFDLIHCHNPMGGVLGRLMTWGLRRKPCVIYTAHGFHFYQGAPAVNWLLYYPAEWLLAHRTDCLITINREDYRRACRFRLAKGGFAAYIPGCGLSIARFQTERQGVDRRELGIPEDALFLLSVGELNRNKNHMLVLQALNCLQDPTVCYGICGAGEEAESLRAYAREHGLTKQLYLFGYQTQVEDYLHLADVFVFPSRREGLGMAALEAMAAGLPLITSDCRGTREYMIDGYNGFVVPLEDERSYAEAIRRMKNPAVRLRAGEHGKKQAERFRSETVRACMRKIYERCDRKRKDGA